MSALPHPCLRRWRALSVALAAVVAFRAFSQVQVRTTPECRMHASSVRAFVDEALAVLHGALRVPARSDGAPGMLVEVGYAVPSAKGVRYKIGKLADGGFRPLLSIPHPESVDWTDVRHALAAAEVTAVLREAGWTGSRLPPWLVTGLGESTDPEARGDLFEVAWRLWSRGKAPVVAEMLSEGGETPPCLAAQLVEFLCSLDADGGKWKGAYGELAAGRKLDGNAVARLFIGDGAEAGDLDEAFDGWMAARQWSVLHMGRTYEGTLTRFGLLTRIWPWRRKGWADVPMGGVPLADAAGGMEPSELQGLSGRMRIASAGRSDEFRLMAAAFADYCSFYAVGQTNAAAGRHEEAGRQLSKIKAKLGIGAGNP